MKICGVDAYPIFDSRGHPTLEAVVTLEDGSRGAGLVPSGASTGSHEAWELRDGDPKKFGGRFVGRAIENVRTIIGPALLGCDAADQPRLDERMIALDGTPNKGRLGANAILGVSMAAAAAAAASRKLLLFEHLGGGGGTLLPLPEIQIFGGGRHAHGRMDVQDFMVVAMGARTYWESLAMTSDVFHKAGAILERRGILAGAADEGGYWPMFSTNDEVLETLVEAITEGGYRPGRDIGISLDIAATDLFQGGCYRFGVEKRSFSSAEFCDLMESWLDKYPIVAIEDPMAEDDWDGWRMVRERLGDRVQLIGDDLFTTNLERIEKGIELRLANAVLIKLNQVGTVSETMDAIERTQAAGWRPVISARSGETEDAFIAHLAVATNAGQLKVGSFCRSERMAKWNEVLRIERKLGERAQFIGGKVFDR